MTTTKQSSPLVLDAVDCKARKISNNLLNFGPEKVTAFTIPLEEIPLKGQLVIDQLLGKGSFRSLFDQDESNGLWSPATWWSVIEGGVLKLAIAIEVDDVELIVGPHTLVLEHDQDSEGNDRAIGKITDIVLKAVGGGLLVMSLHLMVRPGRGRENLILQDSQYEAITVTLGDTRLIQKPSARQQSLDLKPPTDPPAAGAGAHAEQQQILDTAAAAPGEIVDNDPLGVGPAAQGIDVADGTEPVLSVVDGAIGASRPATAEELAEFEENTRKQLEAATAVPGHVVDGTTPASRAAAKSRVNLSKRH